MRAAIAPLTLFSVLVASAPAAAQAPPGAPPAPADPGPPGIPANPYDAPAAPAAAATPSSDPGLEAAADPGLDAAPDPAADPAFDAEDDGLGLEAEFASDEDADLAANTDAPTALDDATRHELRRLTLKLGTTERAASGLLRVSEAYSGDPGTFRLGLLASFSSAKGFLCDGTSEQGCEYLVPGSPQSDKVSRIGADLALSLTFTEFLEAFVGLHAYATSNDQGRPQLLQVLGDTNWGLKGFLPHRPGRIFGLGGELELWLLNGTGGVGINGDGTGFAMRLLGSADLTNRVAVEDRVPFRAHFNLGYRFNNAGKLVEETELLRGGEDGLSRITRIERFGLDIARVNAVELGFGVETPFEYVRPFLEWTFDIPHAPGEKYACNTDRLQPGDGCMALDKGWSTTPSRIGLGARVYPVIEGLSALLAFEIATGGSREFIEEVVPEIPWAFRLGLGWAADARKPAPIVQQVEVERLVEAPQDLERVVLGQVVDQTTGTPVSNAVVRFSGRAITGMITGEDGAFRTIDLEPGDYTFAIQADGYRDAECQVSVPVDAPATAAPFPGDPAAGIPGPASATPTPELGVGGNPLPAAAPVAPGITVGVDGKLEVGLRCPVAALPKVGIVLGAAVDAATGAPIPGARVKIQDKLGRQLELSADGAGAFRFENVPPGPVKLFVEAPDYLRAVGEVEVEARQENRARLPLNKRPQQSRVVVTTTELKLKDQVHFEHDSARILAESNAVIEEIADTLRRHPEIQRVEIQGHTDNTGTAAYNKRLSQERAESVVKALITLGVAESRLEARGYGQEQPIVPNVSDANRAKNRRVQLLIRRGQ